MSMQEKKLTHYLEIRPARHTMHDGLATDLARHLHSRQHLGSAVIVTEEPLKLLAVVRKQWFKLARGLQRERASTVNAQKILHLTYAVTRMHNLAFTAKPPEQRPEADVFFVRGDQMRLTPAQCYSLYLTKPVEAVTLESFISQLPPESLIVDYASATSRLTAHLKAKATLSEQVRTQRLHVTEFLRKLHSNIEDLARQATLQPSLLDDAIDLLLDYSADFLRVASSFQHSLQLAQPYEPARETKLLYNTLALLAHRVQSLNTGQLDDYLNSVVLDSSFFLRESGGVKDQRRRQLSWLLAYHQQAGHTRICQKLNALAWQHSGASEARLAAAVLTLAD